MSDLGIGCVLVLGFVVLPLVLVTWYAINSNKRADAQKHARGKQITDLLAQLQEQPESESLQHELYRLMREPAVGYVPELTTPSGWFETVSPLLTRLARSGSGTKFVDAYFETFSFPSGQQAKVLEFLASLFSDTANNEQRELFKRVAASVLSVSSPAEAQWLYGRALDLVRHQRGTPDSKDIALYVGRYSYAAARPGRRPTVYDEQAIANDIAVQVG